MPNHISYEEFKFDFELRNELRKQYKVEDKFVIGMIGRLEIEKNHIYILKQLNKLIFFNNFIHLFIIGSGNLNKKLLKYVKKNHLQDYVSILESRSDIFKYYSLFDIFLLPSIYEGFGIVGLEAQVNGLKTLCSTNVPKDIKVSNKIEFIKLNNKKKWINEIKSSHIRENYEINEINLKFDISNLDKRLKDIYGY